MDFGKAFSFVFEDDNWIVKLLIGGVLMLVPILGWFVVLGWMLEIGRRVVNGEADVLPAWDDFGAFLIRGVKGAVVTFVYYLPTLILMGCAQGLMFLGGGQGGDSMSSLATLVNSLASCVTFFYNLFIALILPAALMRFTMEGDDIGAGLAFGKVLSMVKDNLGAYLFVFLGYIIVELIAPFGLLAICVGILFTMSYGAAVLGHLYGQAYAEAAGVARPLGGPPPAAPAASADWDG